MLFGKTNPSGKLPFSFPQSVGHLPVYYNYLPTDKGYYHQHGSVDKPGRDYVFSSPDALWSFGYGLSYTKFKFVDVTLSDSLLNATDTLKIKVHFSNIGDRKGKEVVQLYVRDLVSSIATPIKQLKGFAKVDMEPGNTAVVDLKLPIAELALYNIAMKKVVEPGDFEIQIGDASDHIIFNKRITLTDLIKTPAIKKPASVLKPKQQGKNARLSVESIIITGEVRDVQATPVSNVTVKSVRLGKQSVADTQGRYAINAYTDDKLIFSAPGYEDLTIEVKNQSSISIRLNNKQN